jgi:hypothetical protein
MDSLTASIEIEAGEIVSRHHLRPLRRGAGVGGLAIPGHGDFLDFESKCIR